jgi:putative hydrolase of the HAD superfamily
VGLVGNVFVCGSSGTAGGFGRFVVVDRVQAQASMVRAVLFDLFETLITESGIRRTGVSSLAAGLGCEREAFGALWRAVRPAVMIGRVSFRQALSDIAARLGSRADDATLQRMCDERIAATGEAFAQIEPQILMMLDRLRRQDLRLGIVSNCFAEDVAAWPRCFLTPRVDCTVFSFEVGLAKPNPEIYLEATRRLGVDVSETWFIGDGAHGELSGAEQAGLRAFKALWFLKRWPHYQEVPRSTSSVASVDEFVSLVEQSLEPSHPTA